jgi:hypothetical protein
VPSHFAAFKWTLTSSAGALRIYHALIISLQFRIGGTSSEGASSGTGTLLQLFKWDSFGYNLLSSSVVPA